jgi:hypothetical protein
VSVGDAAYEYDLAQKRSEFSHRVFQHGEIGIRH